MFGIILYWITASLIKKDNLVLKSEIQAQEIYKTYKELNDSFKYFNIKIMIKNNFDIKPVILKLFYFSLWINIIFTTFAIMTLLIYVSVFFYDFFGIQNYDHTYSNWNWEIGTPIINFLFIIFLIKVISDSYKLSLRDKYRNSYLKLLYLDFITLNIFSIIGILIFAKNKNKKPQINNDYEVNNSRLNSETIKQYLKLIFKIEIIILVPSLIISSVSLICGYFISINAIKIICLVGFFWSMAIIYCWSIPRIIGLIIAQKMFKKLVNNNNYYYLLTTIRFLAFPFGCYYISVLINFLKFDKDSKELIIETW